MSSSIIYISPPPGELKPFSLFAQPLSSVLDGPLQPQRHTFAPPLIWLISFSFMAFWAKAFNFKFFITINFKVCLLLYITLYYVSPNTPKIINKKLNSTISETPWLLRERFSFTINHINFSDYGRCC